MTNKTKKRNLRRAIVRSIKRQCKEWYYGKKGYIPDAEITKLLAKINSHKNSEVYSITWSTLGKEKQCV